jgi:P-type conjugative transfer ATPase TrbB
MQSSVIASRKRAQEKDNRIYNMLYSSFGPIIRDLLQDHDVIEIMLNPDSSLWVDRLSSGRGKTAHTISPEDAERILRIVSSQVGSVCNAEHPILSAELPGCGSRFQGVFPPIVENPTFSIRKKAIMVYTLHDYVQQGIMTGAFAGIIQDAVKQKENILIIGGTGSGKTTLANAVLHEISRYEDRIIIIEDTLELQCHVKDYVSLRTKDGTADMTALLKATLRLRPDRIVVGEVRGGEALALLKAWNTGHPGGLSTVHANGPRQGLVRIEQLVQEVAPAVPKGLIADAIDLLVFIQRHGTGRRVSEICRVCGCKENEYVLEHFSSD